jgi:DNA-binding NarL/FixJ family response regulator
VPRAKAAPLNSNFHSDMLITPRVRQIVSLLLEGCSNQEIASDLGITSRTVKGHLRTLYVRAGITDGRKRVRLLELLADGSERAPLPTLDAKLQRIAQLTISGFTNPEIASQCAVSEQMIKNHLRSIFDKCGVWSRTELAAKFRCA